MRKKKEEKERKWRGKWLLDLTLPLKPKNSSKQIKIKKNS